MLRTNAPHVICLKLKISGTLKWELSIQHFMITVKQIKEFCSARLCSHSLEQILQWVKVHWLSPYESFYILLYFRQTALRKCYWIRDHYYLYSFNYELTYELLKILHCSTEVTCCLHNLLNLWYSNCVPWNPWVLQPHFLYNKTDLTQFW